MARQAVMVRQVCTLVPFDPACSPDILVSAEVIWRMDGVLELSYGLRSKVNGSLSALLLQPSAQIQQRRDQLWMHSCFEAFLSLPNQKKYWELNISPSGDWNVYSLENYRQGQMPESTVESPRVRVQRTPLACQCDVQLDLNPWWPDVFRAPQLGLAVVLEQSDASLSYWAIRHHREVADFHDRRSFLQL